MSTSDELVKRSEHQELRGNQMYEGLIAKLRAVRVKTPEEVLADMPFESSNYIMMPRAKHYTHALKALRDACATDKNSIQPESFGLVRPLTLEETMRARVEDYNRLTNQDGSARELEDRRHLFSKYFYTASAVVYKGGTTKFKIVPLSKHLVTLREDFMGTMISVNYDDFSDYEELESAAGSISRGGLLSLGAILGRSAWRAFVQDKELLREYQDIVSEVCDNPQDAMSFWVVKNPAEDHLRALFFDNLGNSSYAVGDGGLHNYGFFIRVTK